jgi:hypothetical protein
MTTMDLGKVLASSGYFADAKSISQAVVKVLAGRELGLAPVASMSGINIIQGRPALSANIMASLVKRSGRYDYRVKEMTDKNCSIEFFEKVDRIAENPDGKTVSAIKVRESIGVSTFSLAEAQKAGTKNLDKFPRNMLFARSMSNGVRWYCPDVTQGPVYTPEELGAETDEEGQLVSAPEPIPVSPRIDMGETVDATPVEDCPPELVKSEPGAEDSPMDKVEGKLADLSAALGFNQDYLSKALTAAKSKGVSIKGDDGTTKKYAAGMDSMMALQVKWLGELAKKGNK